VEAEPNRILSLNFGYCGS